MIVHGDYGRHNRMEYDRYADINLALTLIVMVFLVLALSGAN